jgi:hypothetical protein
MRAPQLFGQMPLEPFRLAFSTAAAEVRNLDHDAL